MMYISVTVGLHLIMVAAHSLALGHHIGEARHGSTNKGIAIGLDLRPRLDHDDGRGLMPIPLVQAIAHQLLVVNESALSTVFAIQKW